MTKIFLKNYRLSGIHGVYSHERRVEQEFVIDIVAEVDTTVAEQSDNVQDTVSYLDFKKTIDEVFANHSYYLIEKLAHDIAKKVLDDKRIETIEITIRKPEVLPNGDVGITYSQKNS